jgi:mono/diheme cytochrome c family protein
MNPRIFLILGSLVVPSLALQAQGGNRARNPPVQSHLQSSSPVALPAVAEQQQLVKQYCVGCHSGSARNGDFSWDGLDLADPAAHAEQLEKVILKLRAKLMPPPNARKPPGDELARLATALETALDAEAAARPNPGMRAIHRLNRAEYAAAVRDLLNVSVDIESMLPPDEMSRGYPNMSDVLKTSASLIEGYVRAASRISRVALGDPETSRAVTTYTIPRIVSQLRHIEGTPFGTRGGLAVVHNFPADAEYIFRLSFYYSGLAVLYGQHELQGTQQIEVAVNGERVALLDVPPRLKLATDLRTVRIPVKAGPQRISAAFIAKADGPVDDVVMPPEQSLVDVSNANVPGITALPHLRDLAVDGPYDANGVSDTPSRARILACRPKSAADETACAKTIINRLTRLAFRRPVSDTDTQSIVRLYGLGREQGTFEDGIRTAVQAIITSPEFIFRIERTPEHAAPGSNYRITDIDLATRLSFFLWSSTPDDELLTLAAANKLSDRATLERQVRRMLKDPKSEALALNFASYWLHLQNLKDMRPDSYQYPDYDANLAKAMARETQLFFDSIVREDRPILELLTADYTFVDERMAKHYGIPNVLGNHFRRVPVTDPERRGLLGHASILTVTSYANRTSPVLRGKWVMDVLLGTPPPKPPPNIPPLKENSHEAKPVTVRERLEEHRRNPSCAACHRMMDPIGYALENYDVIGNWRIKDAGVPVDASGELVNGTVVDGPASLRAAIVGQKHLFEQKFTHDLLMYAIGRVVQYYDMPAVRAIQREATRDGNRFSSLVLGIVNSAPFRMRRAEPVTTTEEPQGGRRQ